MQRTRCLAFGLLFVITAKLFTIMLANYPEHIQSWLLSTSESLVETEFFGDQEIDSTIGKRIYASYAAPIALQSWVDTGEIMLTDEQFTEILHKTVISATFASLQEKGFLNSIEDSTGEEHFFLTQAGKEIASEIKNKS